MNELRKELFTLQDPSYLEFHSKLIPTIEKTESSVSAPLHCARLPKILRVLKRRKPF